MNSAQYFADTGFLDLLPLAHELAAEGGYDDLQMIEAISLTFDKSREYPPIKNRRKWFQIVFAEKLAEVQSIQARQAFEMRMGWRSGS